MLARTPHPHSEAHRGLFSVQTEKPELREVRPLCRGHTAHAGAEECKGHAVCPDIFHCALTTRHLSATPATASGDTFLSRQSGGDPSAAGSPGPAQPLLHLAPGPAPELLSGHQRALWARSRLLPAPPLPSLAPTSPGQSPSPPAAAGPCSALSSLPASPAPAPPLTPSAPATQGFLPACSMLPRGLCTGHALCLECCSSRYLHDLFLASSRSQLKRHLLRDATSDTAC